MMNGVPGFWNTLQNKCATDKKKPQISCFGAAEGEIESKTEQMSPYVEGGYKTEVTSTWPISHSLTAERCLINPRIAPPQPQADPTSALTSQQQHLFPRPRWPAGPEEVWVLSCPQPGKEFPPGWGWLGNAVMAQPVCPLLSTRLKQVEKKVKTLHSEAATTKLKLLTDRLSFPFIWIYCLSSLCRTQTKILNF